MYCIRQIQNFGVFRTLFVQICTVITQKGTYSDISTLLRHIHTRGIIFSTLCNPRIFTALPYTKPWHIYNPLKLWQGIFRNLTDSESCNIQNPSIIASWRVFIFPTIGKPCVTLEVQYPGILTIMEYSEPGYIKTRSLFRTLSNI